MLSSLLDHPLFPSPLTSFHLLMAQPCLTRVDGLNPRLSFALCISYLFLHGLYLSFILLALSPPDLHTWLKALSFCSHMYIPELLCKSLTSPRLSPRHNALITNYKQCLFFLLPRILCMLHNHAVVDKVPHLHICWNFYKKVLLHLSSSEKNKAHGWYMALLDAF